jgi:hypothetical protein
VDWVEVFAVFIVSHLVGDYLLQTDWQAIHKREESKPTGQSRQALALHGLTYGAAFVPALVWLSTEIGLAALGIAALIVVPHVVQDDGRLLIAYVRKVKRSDMAIGDFTFIAVDQTFHVLALFGAALLAAS